MKKLCIICLLMLFVLPAKAESNKPLQILMETDYGRIRLEWNETQDAQYRVTVQSIDEKGDIKDLYSEWFDYHACYMEDRVAYLCQENGFPYRMQFYIETLIDDEVTAEGTSDPVDPREFFPEKEELLLEKDIPLDTITSFYWHTSGSYMQANQSLLLYKEDDSYVLSGSYYKDENKEVEVERKLKEKDWNEFLELIKNGKVTRKYVMDPEIVILDGGESGMQLQWDDMSYAQENYYVYTPEDYDAIVNWLKNKGKPVFSFHVAGIGGALAAGLLAGAFMQRKKKR